MVYPEFLGLAAPELRRSSVDLRPSAGLSSALVAAAAGGFTGYARGSRGERRRAACKAAADEASSRSGQSSAPRRGFVQALTTFTSAMASRADAKVETIDMGDPNKCIYCLGDGILQCWRCSGTKKMAEIDDPTKFRDCSECEATGYKPCGTCQTTGLSPKLVKLYARDEKFRKIMARLRKTKCDEDGRAKIKRVMTNAIAEVEAKQAALEGRDAMILKVPEAPTPEPSGTWIGS